MRGMQRRIGFSTSVPGEAEQVFFDRPLVVVEGEQRTEFTRRYYALGQTIHAGFSSLCLPSVMISSV